MPRNRQFKGIGGSQSINPNQWSGLVLFSSNSGLLTEEGFPVMPALRLGGVGGRVNSAFDSCLIDTGAEVSRCQRRFWAFLVIEVT